jgi:phenylacetate-CoA ligase
MPFIRYRVGDLAASSDGVCPCGRGLALLGDLRGRTNDLLVSPGGRVLHSLSVIYVLREIRGLRQFKVTQQTIDHFLVDVVTDADFEAGSEPTIARRICQVIGGPVRVDIVHRDEIPPEASGKYRWVVSRVEHPV